MQANRTTASVRTLSLLQTLHLLELPLWIPRAKAEVKERSDHSFFQWHGGAGVYAWLIWVDETYGDEAEALSLLENVLWSIGVQKSQYCYASRCKAGAPVKHEESLASALEIAERTHPAFMLSFGVFTENPVPQIPHLAIPWTLLSCLKQPLLKQQVMYALYRFMHLSKA